MASLTAAPEAPSTLLGASENTTRWGAVYAIARCSFVLVASEFMPVSLLSPIAHNLSLTDGPAGQAIAVSGVIAVVTRLALSSVLGRADRRVVVLTLTALLVVSGAIVAVAPT